MIEYENNQGVACFEVNEHGRIFSGNKAFCRLFGFEKHELEWHYMKDLYRFQKDYDAYRSNGNLLNCSFVAKLRNRKGRSFPCSISREAVLNEEGRLRFHVQVRRLNANEKPLENNVSAIPSTVVLLAKCTCCGASVPVKSVGEARLKVVCSSCAAKVYPEAFALKAAQV